MRVVAALGGNAFVPTGEALTAEGEHRFARAALAHLGPFLDPSVELLVTHGNGPQVGHQLERVERSRGLAYTLPLDLCVAQTQGELGYVLAQALSEVMLRRGMARPVASLITQVEVRADDVAFHHPTKPVGPVLAPERVSELRSRGATVVEDPGRGPRRVVASPEPVRVAETEVIRRLLVAGVVVVAAGGGGVPVVMSDGETHGMEAVIDKDHTAALLADELDADLLLLLTDVPCAYTDFLGPRPARVGLVSAAQARALTQMGHFAPGSMRPKVEAAARFARCAGRRAVICDPAGLESALRGESGTTVIPDG
jgi:carbamate kinase